MRFAAFALGIVAVGPLSGTTISVTFDPSQPTPAGQTGVPPAAGTANNDFSLWGVQYQLTGGDNTGCSSMGGNSLCFGDMIGTEGLGFSLLSDPVLSGPLVPGVALTLTFAAPTGILDFDVALGVDLDTSECPLTQQSYDDSMPDCPVSVALYGASGGLLSGGSDQWTLPDDSILTEGGFTYSGPAVTEAVLTFPGSDSSDSMFGIDNLTYQAGTSQAPATPEPATSLLIGLGMIVLSLSCRRKSRLG